MGPTTGSLCISTEIRDVPSWYRSTSPCWGGAPSRLGHMHKERYQFAERHAAYTRYAAMVLPAERLSGTACCAWHLLSSRLQVDTKITTCTNLEPEGTGMSNRKKAQARVYIASFTISIFNIHVRSDWRYSASSPRCHFQKQIVILHKRGPVADRNIGGVCVPELRIYPSLRLQIKSAGRLV